MIKFAQSNVTEGESFAMIDRRIQSTKSVKEIEARDADKSIALAPSIQ